MKLHITWKDKSRKRKHCCSVTVRYRSKSEIQLASLNQEVPDIIRITPIDRLHPNLLNLKGRRVGIFLIHDGSLEKGRLSRSKGVFHVVVR